MLTGFMGTGKSSVGRRLALALGLGFLDIDKLIEEEAKLPIKEIFSLKGERHFREIESALIERLSTGELGRGLVVSTGGGAVIDPANRERLRSFGKVVCLTASAEEIVRRVGSGEERPLLSEENALTAASSLLEERAAFYADCDLTVATTAKSPEEVVSIIKEFF